MNNGTTATIKSLAEDLVWIDILKGIAIVGVVLDHWVPFWASIASPPQLHSFLVKVPWGTTVQLFFLLSGFGLMTAYFATQPHWSWSRWAWRRITKIVVPYWLAVLFSFLAGILASRIFQSVDLHFSWKSLLACLAFMRPFFPDSWVWNRALWFMPIIIGLYICFPLLAFILKRKGPWVLLVSVVIFNYGSISLYALITGAHGSHNESLFPFFITKFALGMILAYVRNKYPQKLGLMLGLKSFLLGLSLCLLSWAIKTYLPNGSSYNDAPTAVGMFLVLLHLAWIAGASVPIVVRILGSLGKKSYLIFLVHYPIMAFVLGPLLRITLHPIAILASGLVFIAGMYFVCSLISGPLDKCTSWLYRLVFPITEPRTTQ